MKKKLKQLLIKWLSEEYTVESATKQIESAKIEEKKILVITYDTGVQDIVEIEGDTVKHLNPYKTLSSL